MKASRFLLVVGAALMVAVAAQASGEGWLTDFAEAEKQAAERQVPILVDFSGSDWCGWCIRLDKEVFSKPEFKAYAQDSLVLLLVDFPQRQPLPEAQQRHNMALAEKYGVEGFPTVLLLDAEGRELARTGYREGGAQSYVRHLKELLAAKPGAGGGK